MPATSFLSEMDTEMILSNIHEKKELRLGMMGMSPGNGHPYSWSAIFNGYNEECMRDCPFPAIPRYLSQQAFPIDAIQGAKVTHIWTQDKEISRHIALASNIENIVEHPFEMIGSVDGILLARDDYQSHYEMSKEFIEAGLHVFIDKPLAITVIEAEKIFSLEKFENQIFTCSAFRFANEFQLTNEERREIGDLKYINAWIMKDWEKYAIHVIEPSLQLLPEGSAITSSKAIAVADKKIVTINFDCGVVTTFSTLGSAACVPTINVFGSSGFKELVFQDTFSAFKKSLEAFVRSIRGGAIAPTKDSVLAVIKVIEAGL